MWDNHFSLRHTAYHHTQFSIVSTMLAHDVSNRGNVDGFLKDFNDVCSVFCCPVLPEALIDIVLIYILFSQLYGDILTCVVVPEKVRE